MVTAFNTNVASALNRVAPVKSFKIRSNHRFGLSEGVKSLMKKRDSTRSQIARSSTQEKKALQQQYKVLRNKVTDQIRKEKIDFNNNRVEKLDHY